MSTTQEQQRVEKTIDDYLALTRKAGANDAEALLALAHAAFRRVTE